MHKLILTFIIIIELLTIAGCNSENFSSNNSTHISRKPLPASGEMIQRYLLPEYDDAIANAWQIDLTNSDMTNVDLTNRLHDLNNCDFSSKTKWPDSLPNDFNPKEILDYNKTPGLNIKKLHKEGITGSGVGLAIIDWTLLVDHEEFSDRLKLYEEVDFSDNKAEYHGCATSSIAVGKISGIAPGADLYYISTHMTETINGKTEVTYFGVVKAINRIIEINNSLPKNKKIRVISISTGWRPNAKGAKEVEQAIKDANNNNIFVITANLPEMSGHKFYFHGLEVSPMDDKDNPDNYTVMPWNKWMYYLSISSDMKNADNYYKNAPQEQLLIPVDSKTVASPTGISDYTFYRKGVWSWTMPYIAGLYALCCQVKPDITPEIFWEQALKTGDYREIIKDGKVYAGKMVNPEKLISTLK